jgi:chromosome segregation ATPase
LPAAVFRIQRLRTSAVGTLSSEARTVQEQPRHDREWEHWPGRREPEDGIRHRLRALFATTDDEEAVEALIGERGREIEEQTARLQATIEGLERREEQAARLRAAVEEMLRHGSAELDERHAELSALASELREREERLREQEREIALRKRELGAVELRRAAVERREQAAVDREAALEAAAAEVRRRELELRDAERELEEPRSRTAGSSAAREPEATAHVLFLVDDAYRLVERDGPPPPVGSTVEVEGHAHVVTRVGRSVLPGDGRQCVYLEHARPGPAGSAS